MEKMRAKWIIVSMTVVALGFLMVVPAVLADPLEESTQIVQQWLKAFHEGNAEALAALYAQDAVYIPWAGPFRVEGREAIRTYFAGVFRAFPTRSLVPRDTSGRTYSDTVVNSSNWTFVYSDGAKTVKTVFGRSGFITTVLDGRRMIIDHNTSVIPTAGP